MGIEERKSVNSRHKALEKKSDNAILQQYWHILNQQDNARKMTELEAELKREKAQSEIKISKIKIENEALLKSIEAKSFKAAEAPNDDSSNDYRIDANKYSQI